MALAVASAFCLTGLHLWRFFTGSDVVARWGFKSAFPLMAIGFSYICLIATLRRTFLQRLLGFAVGLAFTLWGVEQFLRNQALISMIDDFVVLLFVFDLSLVVRSNLRDPPGKEGEQR